MGHRCNLMVKIVIRGTRKSRLIPLKLQIKNFLSYGPEPQEIDFTRYHMICLSGKNGHGKSALLDAMTWVVWGQARKTSGQSKPDHGLLHLGERNMRVVFDFEFNSRRYRIRREFTFAYGKPTAYLEFGMFADNSEEVISLTDKTIRKTQDKIELLLGLDFDSFINSAFIRQGNAGEFSQKSPKERKDILSNILGLGAYDKLRKVAAEKSRILDNERQGLLMLHDRLIMDLELQKEVVFKEQVLQDQLIIIKQKQGSCEIEMAAYKDQQQQLVVQQQLNIENNKKILLLKDYYAQGLANLLHLRVGWQQLLTKMGGVLNKQVLELQKNALDQKIIDLRAKQKANWQFRQSLAESKEAYQKIEATLFAAYDQKINQCRSELERQQFNFDYQQNVYNSSVQELTELLQNKDQVAPRLQSYVKLQLECDEMQRSFDRQRDFYQRLIVMGNSAKYEQDDIVRKQLFLGGDCPSCPLCEQSLSMARRRFLAQQFTNHISFTQHRISRVTKLLKILKTKISDQHATLEQLKERLQQVRILQIQQEKEELRIAFLQKHLAVSKQKLTEDQAIIKDLQQKLQQLDVERGCLLKNNAEAALLWKQVQLYETNLRLNHYNEEDLQLCERELEQVLKLLSSDDNDKLLAEQRAQVLAQVSTLVRDLKQQKTLIQVSEKQLKSNIAINNEIDSLERPLLELSREWNTLKIAKESILQQLGSVQEQVKKVALVQIELNNLKQDLKRLESETQDYKVLVGVFGKDGIQALLIEDAIPEIEQEANNLLGRLTDNQAQLFIESLRDLKSGGTKETLDIKISDSVGLRPYEMFSGGEAFRIDFALRIAISKLLARRAGTALQTLIIDEGFGSQDEEGLAHIMDALYKIQDDFAKIIIVSHLNTMKEQFPVHFFINKSAIGSTVSVVEQG